MTNQVAGANVPMIQLATLNQTNTLMLGAAATVTTIASPISSMWVGATSVGNLFANNSFGFQASDGGFTSVVSSTVNGGGGANVFPALYLNPGGWNV